MRRKSQQDQAQDTHPCNKGKNLTPGLSGTTYQIAVLMQFALEASHNGDTFELFTEAEEYGKFDDIVIHRKKP